MRPVPQLNCSGAWKVKCQRIRNTSIGFSQQIKDSCRSIISGHLQLMAKLVHPDSFDTAHTKSTPLKSNMVQHYLVGLGFRIYMRRACRVRAFGTQCKLLNRLEL